MRPSPGSLAPAISSPAFGVETEAVPRVIAVTSGQGGVGKTVLAANLALAFARGGKRVLLIEADLGLGNLNLFFGLAPPVCGLNDFFSRGKGLEEILIKGPQGVWILPAGPGGEATTHLSSHEKLLFLEALNQLHEEFDLVLIDVGAGLSESSVYFTVAAHAILVVTTPDPVSLAKAAGLMQLLAAQYQEKRFQLAINAGRNEKQALATFDKFTSLLGNSPGFSVVYLGHLPHARAASRNLSRRQAPGQFSPETSAGQALELICHRLESALETIQPKGNLQFFWSRMMTSITGTPLL